MRDSALPLDAGWGPAAGIAAAWGLLSAFIAGAAALLAEGQVETWIQLLGAIIGGGALLKILQYVGDWWAKSSQDKRTSEEKAEDKRRKERRDSEQTAVGYYKDLIERLQKNQADTMAELEEARQVGAAKIEKLTERIDQERAKCATLELKFVRAQVYTEYLIERLRDSNVKFRQWSDTPAGGPPVEAAPPQPSGGSSHRLPAAQPPEENSDEAGK
jgi:hypothetical protein